MRFHSAPVYPAERRQAHAPGPRRPGRWRLAALRLRRPHRPGQPGSQDRQLCDFLASDKSRIGRFTPVGAEPDSVIDVRAIFQQGHRDLAVSSMPAVLLPRKGRFGLIDYEKAFCPDPAAGDVFDLRGIDRGCRLLLVVVQPDQYVSHVLPLDVTDDLVAFLAGILVNAAERDVADAG